MNMKYQRYQVHECSVTASCLESIRSLIALPSNLAFAFIHLLIWGPYLLSMGCAYLRLSTENTVFERSATFAKSIRRRHWKGRSALDFIFIAQYWCGFLTSCIMTALYDEATLSTCPGQGPITTYLIWKDVTMNGLNKSCNSKFQLVGGKNTQRVERESRRTNLDFCLTFVEMNGGAILNIEWDHVQK